MHHGTERKENSQGNGEEKFMLTAVDQLQNYESLFEQIRRLQERFLQDKVVGRFEKIQSIGRGLEAECGNYEKTKQSKQLLTSRKQKIMFKCKSDYNTFHSSAVLSITISTIV